MLVATTIAVLATGGLLLAAGHESNTLLLAHQISLFAWAAVFAVHFLAYLPRVARSLRVDWGAARREAPRGSGARGMLVAAALGGGAALSLALLPTMAAWHGGH